MVGHQTNYTGKHRGLQESMRLKLPKAKDSIGIVFNFFDFLTILYGVNMQPNKGGPSLKYALELCNRHVPPGKKVGLDLFPKR